MVYYILTAYVCQFQIGKVHFCISTGVQMSSQNIHSIFGPNLFEGHFLYWVLTSSNLVNFIEYPKKHPIYLGNLIIFVLVTEHNKFSIDFLNMYWIHSHILGIMKKKKIFPFHMSRILHVTKFRCCKFCLKSCEYTTFSFKILKKIKLTGTWWLISTRPRHCI